MGKRDEEKRQKTLEGEVVEGEKDDEKELNDFGEEMKSHETKGGFNRYIIGSALQKAVRRSDVELAAFAAWELVRSGDAQWFWKRARMIALEEFISEDTTLLLVEKLDEAAHEWEYELDGWEGKIMAIRAAIAMARGTKSREYSAADAYFTRIANERAKAEKEEDFETDLEFPEIPDAVYDKHTFAGKNRGRGHDHFTVHSSRLSNYTEVEKYWKRKAMEGGNITWDWADEDMTFTDKEIEYATTPTDDDEPWKDDGLDEAEITDFDE